LLFNLIITTVKISILWFYHTIFGINKLIRNVIRITGAACIAWFLVATPLVVNQCSPVQALWEHLGQEPWCLNAVQGLLGIELTNFFLDVAILLIPLLGLRNLRLQTTKKILLAGIFLLGAL
jgi:hypothetical protein